MHKSNPSGLNMALIKTVQLWLFLLLRGDFSFYAIESITSQKICCRVSGKMQFFLNEFGGVASDANNLLVTICSSPSVPAIHHIHSADSKHIEVPFTSSFIGGKLPPW